MNWRIRFLLALFIEWPLCLLVSGIFSLLSVVVVPLAYWLGETEQGGRPLLPWRVLSLPFNDRRRVRAWRASFWTYPWGNEEDGIDGLPTKDGVVFKNQFWQYKTRGWSDFSRIFAWCVLRNSASNLRFMPITGYQINPNKVRLGAHELLNVTKYDGHIAHDGEWYFTWEGWRSTVYFEWKGVHFLMGWNQRPEDADSRDNALPADDTRAPGVTFKLQIRR